MIDKLVCANVSREQGLKKFRYLIGGGSNIDRYWSYPVVNGGFQGNPIVQVSKFGSYDGGVEYLEVQQVIISLVDALEIDKGKLDDLWVVLRVPREEWLSHMPRYSFDELNLPKLDMEISRLGNGHYTTSLQARPVTRRLDDAVEDYTRAYEEWVYSVFEDFAEMG